MIIPQRYENAEWEQIPERVRKLVEAMTATKKGLYIHGAVGTGKTHISYAIGKHFAAQNQWIRFWNVVDLLHEIRADFDRHVMDKSRPEEELTRRDERKLLILDDIGTEKATDFAAETLYRIINHRYNLVIPTIFTSNLNIEELAEKIGDRSASRIVEMCEIVELTGTDRRLKK